MKVSAFVFVAAYAAFTQLTVTAAPTPIRLLVISSPVQEDSPLKYVRFGHPVPYPNHGPDNQLIHFPPPPPSGKEAHLSSKRFRHRPGCNGRKNKLAIFMHKIKIKAINISNSFRKALGWPLIQVEHRHHHHKHAHPLRPEDRMKDEVRIDGGFVSILPFPSIEPENIHDEPKHHRHFLSRLHHSLMNLGRWEGRAIAFVIGCGIGVLVRMFWVLAIVSYRAFRGYRDDGYATVGFIEEDDMDDDAVISSPSPKTAPPKYIYPVDEKTVTEEMN